MLLDGNTTALRHTVNVSPGYVDGPLLSASFGINGGLGLAVDQAGKVYVVDGGNRIRKIQ